jgi:hypothetical protein
MSAFFGLGIGMVRTNVLCVLRSPLCIMRFFLVRDVALAVEDLRLNGKVRVELPVRLQSCHSTISAIVINQDGDILNARTPHSRPNVRHHSELFSVEQGRVCQRPFLRGDRLPKVHGVPCAGPLAFFLLPLRLCLMLVTA